MSVVQDQSLDDVLPVGWCMATLGDVGQYINGRGFKSNEWGTVGRPILRIQNLTGSRSALNRFDGEVEPRHVVQDGTLLISWAATLGAYIYKGEEAALNQHIFKVVPFIDKWFLYYGVLHYIQLLKVQSRGSGMQHVTKGDFEATPFPVPPPPEQHRIVNKIEELFGKLDAGVAELKRTQGLLRRYRQSLLHAAVTGELTREWRDDHGTDHPDAESAEHLLGRILAERRDRWVAEGKKGVYKEPAAPDITGLPELPAGWVWATLPQIGELGRGKSKHRPRNAPHLFDGTYPFIQTGEVRLSGGIN
ncbi:restriction endonuclease subunit S [Deinococcus koreensis]|uniref:restriction endonuclease subunit S n=1 Tax=Deinococcus koreensis TaxID=2054903 RepID=UPI001056E98C|nr:restriction endonuclease subunit S [Deinococcus koreensis]